MVLACRADQSLPVDPGKMPEAPMFGHGGLGGTVIGTPLDADAAASDTGVVLPRKCMGTDAFESGLVTGMKSESDLTCTSKEVVVGSAVLRKYSYFGGSTINYTGQPVTCPSGSSIFLSFSLEFAQIANSPRTDLGLWVARDGGTALTGECSHYILQNGPTDVDGDFCGDLLPGVTIQAGLATVLATCDSLRDGVAHVGACVAWTDPDTNRYCSQGPLSASRYGSLPGTKAKCNCDGVNVAINIAQ
jgi:hypothetical protein